MRADRRAMSAILKRSCPVTHHPAQPVGKRAPLLRPVKNKQLACQRRHPPKQKAFWGPGFGNGGSLMNLESERRGYRGEPMTFVSMQHIPLTKAYLCQDCNSVGNCAVQCPACASEALMGLAGVLDRPAAEPAQNYPVQSSLPQTSFERQPALAA
jgi:hypothetical protein